MKLAITLPFQRD